MIVGVRNMKKMKEVQTETKTKEDERTWYKDEGRLKTKITWTEGSPVVLMLNAVERMLKEKLNMNNRITLEIEEGCLAYIED